MIQTPVYLDNNATTPLDMRVWEAMTPYLLKHFGNASSRSHAYGWEAAEAVDYAREQVARLIHAEPKEILFTSGATEACNLALKGVSETYIDKGNHIITVSTEHSAVLETCGRLEKNGARVTRLAVNSEGLIDMKDLEAAITPETILIAAMYANNETGVIQPIREIGALSKKHGVLFFSDATQALGKIPVDVIADHIDLLALSAHKIYGPKGVGALYVRRKNPRVRLTAQIDGGGHERGLRSGTLNVPGIVGLGKACELCQLYLQSDQAHFKTLTETLESALLQIEGISLHGHPRQRLPNVTNVGFRIPGGENLLSSLSPYLAISSGSACASDQPKLSHVLAAMGVDESESRASLRFSVGRMTTAEEIDFAIETIRQAVGKIEKDASQNA